MIQAWSDDWNKQIAPKRKGRNDQEYINAGRRYLREVLETVKEIAESIRDNTDDGYQKVPFDRSCDAINVLLYNHLSNDWFKGISFGTLEEKKEFAQLIDDKHESFTV